VSWSLRFAEPIVLADGVKLATLRQAVSHLVKTVPPAEHGEPIEFAGIATLKAINRHAQRVFNPDRKETKWGRRKWRATDNGKYCGYDPDGTTTDVTDYLGIARSGGRSLIPAISA
jgi:hypothetical protein